VKPAPPLKSGRLVSIGSSSQVARRCGMCMIHLLGMHTQGESSSRESVDAQVRKDNAARYLAQELLHCKFLV
jgi:hypothetical protein